MALHQLTASKHVLVTTLGEVSRVLTRLLADDRRITFSHDLVLLTHSCSNNSVVAEAALNNLLVSHMSVTLTITHHIQHRFRKQPVNATRVAILRLMKSVIDSAPSMCKWLVNELQALDREEQLRFSVSADMRLHAIVRLLDMNC